MSLAKWQTDDKHHHSNNVRMLSWHSIDLWLTATAHFRQGKIRLKLQLSELRQRNWCCECDTRLGGQVTGNQSNVVVKVNPWMHFAGDDIGVIKQMRDRGISWFLANWWRLDLTNLLVTCLLISSLSVCVLCSCHSVVALDGQVTRNWSNVAVNWDVLNASQSARALPVPGILNVP